MNPGSAEPGDAPTVGAYLERWLSDVEGDVKRPTWEFYRGNVERYLAPTLGDRPLDALSVEELERTFDDLVAAGGHDGGPLNPVTVAKAASTLRKALDNAVDDGLLRVNLVRRCQLPRPSDPGTRSRGSTRRTWTRREARRFLDEIFADRYRALWIVALGTGMRRGELLGLHWSDIDLDRGVLQVRHALRGRRRCRRDLRTSGSRQVADHGRPLRRSPPREGTRRRGALLRLRVPRSRGRGTRRPMSHTVSMTHRVGPQGSGRNDPAGPDALTAATASTRDLGSVSD